MSIDANGSSFSLMIFKYKNSMLLQIGFNPLFFFPTFQLKKSLHVKTTSCYVYDWCISITKILQKHVLHATYLYCTILYVCTANNFAKKSTMQNIPDVYKIYYLSFYFFVITKVIIHNTLPIAKILSVKNARAWVSMVSYLKT